ncbi:MAG TPA: RNA-binding domain-containing protein [Candidatus Bathyarchaeia archaeon]|nr:RNA-binding domain-containing protein [Candidatus Bathyarchaeia archaeon]
MEEIIIRMETEINPTEDEEKVKMAVANLFGNISTQTKPSYKGSILTAEAKGQEALVKLRNLLRMDRVRDAARKVLYEGLRGETISFCLNKQVAFAGHVSFSEEVAESPLGPIKVTIECENPRQLIDWLAPRTN